MGGRGISAGSQTPQELTGGGKEGTEQGGGRSLLERLRKGQRNPTKVVRTPARKEKKVDNTGMVEMQKLMETWTGRRKDREKVEEEVVEAQSVAVKVENIVTVEKPVENIVETVRRKFDKPGPDLNNDSDFASWKRRRTCLHVTVDPDLDPRRTRSWC